MNRWRPITKRELEVLVEEQLADCSAEQRVLFNMYSVPLEDYLIVRCGQLESVFVVARKGDEVMYYEDVEEGFNVSQLADDGTIPEQGCDQDDLRMALLHWK